MDAQTRVWVRLVCVGPSTVGICQVCGHISIHLWAYGSLSVVGLEAQWRGDRFDKACKVIFVNSYKAGKAHKMCNLSRHARVVLKTSPGIAECERQKTLKAKSETLGLKSQITYLFRVR